MKFLRVLTALLLMAATECAAPSPVTATALWSRYIVGGVINATIADGVVLFGIDRRPFGNVVTEALDVRTGRSLWERTGTVPVSGSPLFLANGSRIERVALRSGRVAWNSEPLCEERNAPTYVTTIGSTVYAGCGGGKISALRLSDGILLASAHPVVLDDYDQIVSLGDGVLGIGGEASGAYMYRQSAIVHASTLSAVVAFGPDRRILGTYGGRAVVADVCCQGAHSDSWPADIELVSLVSGRTVYEGSLHPYDHALPPDGDLPGPGMTVMNGRTLYVATHSAIFAYDMQSLNRRPRMLYGDLANMPTLIDGRYLWIQEGAPGRITRVAVSDTDAGMRVIWSGAQQVTFFNGRARAVDVDASCRISATSEHHAFAECRDTSIASRMRIGDEPKPIISGQNALLPEAIAVYDL